ncbi:MAG: tetratricopeptide repeat protein [Sphingomonadales bacterium]|nr:MAG: tetratricopeptide repeat protein [Sphingomonadales bacterium]
MKPKGTAALDKARAALHAGDATEAARLARTAIKMGAHNTAAWHLLALATAGQQDFDAAIPAFEEALKLAPRDAVVASDYAGVLAEVGLFEQALACADHALVIDPQLAPAWVQRGKALNGLEQMRDAIQALNRALQLAPDLASGHYTYGQVLEALKQPDRALQAYTEAARHAPAHRDAHQKRGRLALQLEKFAEAAESFARALALSPDDAGLLNNHAMALHGLGRFDEALALCDQIIAISPALASAHVNRGRALQMLGRYKEALDAFERAHRLDPDGLPAALNLAMLRLTLGDLARGFAGYESRKRMPELEVQLAGRTHVAGLDALKGRTLIIEAEQGLGDTVQFARFAPRLARHAARTVLAVQSSLVPLMKTLSGVEVMANDDPALPDDAVHALIMSLPHLLGETDVRAAPYLVADPKRVAHWKERIGPQGCRIGINWQGRAVGGDIHRSFPLAALAPIAALPGVRLISLQKYDGLDQLAQLPAGMTVETLGEAFDAQGGAFLDSAAVMQCLDLTITCDTALAHVAGAIGAPVWLALQFVAEWRWGMEGAQTPWYPTMRLFRQSQRGDWAGVFARMAEALAQAVS